MVRTISEALKTYARHGRAFLITSALFLLPIGVVQMLVRAPAETGASALPYGTATSALMFVFQLVAAFLTGAALTTLAADVATGGPGRWDVAWRRGIRRGGPVVGATFALVVPAIAYLIPVVLLAAILVTALHLGPPAMLAIIAVAAIPFLPLGALISTIPPLEGRGGFEGLRRSWRTLRQVSRSNLLALTVVAGAATFLGSLFVWILPNHRPLADFLNTLAWSFTLPLEALVGLAVYREVRAKTENAGDPELRAQLDAIDAGPVSGPQPPRSPHGAP